jgi:hypothetical protein
MRTTRTLKHWGNDSNHLFSPNVKSDNAVDELTELVKRDFPGYIQISFFERENRGLRTHKSKGCDKLYVYAWYWNGSWSAPTKELVSVLYRPK